MIHRRQRSHFAAALPPVCSRGAKKIAQVPAYLGATMATIRLPWCDGLDSTLPTSCNSIRMWSITLRPSSTWAISRPRKITETTTLSLCSKNWRAWFNLKPRSCSPVLGRTRISLILL